MWYCTCNKTRSEGWTHKGDQLWVHDKCDKPSRMVFERMLLLNRYWQELDDIVDRIASKQEAEDGLDKGRAETAMYFIAILLAPHNPDITKVRAEAARRYKERHK